MAVIRNALLIAGKDLRSEANSKQVLPTMLIFAGLVIVMFSFAFDPNNNSVKAVIPGLIWVITVFAGLLGLNRSFVTEQKNNTIHGLVTAPMDSMSLYLGKFLANFTLILIVQFVATPLLFILFDFHFEAPLGWFVFTLVAGTFGFVSIGTFLAALASNSGSSEMLLPLLMFPITTPLLIGAVECTKVLLANPEDLTNALRWFQLIAGFDILFFGVCIFLFEFIMEV